MFIGFIPVLVGFIAALTSLKDQRAGRMLWFVCALLVTIWAVRHGSNHLPALRKLGSW